MTSFVCTEYLATLYYKNSSSLEKVQSAFFFIFSLKLCPSEIIVLGSDENLVENNSPAPVMSHSGGKNLKTHPNI